MTLIDSENIKQQYAEVQRQALALQKVTKIATRLQQALKSSATSNPSSPSDLVPLSHNFEVLRQQLHQTIAALQKYNSATAQTETARHEMTQSLGILSKDSPLFDLLGNPDPKSDSLMSSETKLLREQPKTRKLLQQAIIYATEWESIVTTYMDGQQKIVHSLRDVLNHYQKKVEKLRDQDNGRTRQGKTSPAKATAKLERNEGKLVQAAQDYELWASLYALLLQQVTLFGWRDLYPMVQQILEYEQQAAQVRMDIVGDYTHRIGELEETFQVSEDWQPPAMQRIVVVPPVSSEAEKVPGDEQGLPKEETDDTKPDEEDKDLESTTPPTTPLKQDSYEEVKEEDDDDYLASTTEEDSTHSPMISEEEVEPQDIDSDKAVNDNDDENLKDDYDGEEETLEKRLDPVFGEETFTKSNSKIEV